MRFRPSITSFFSFRKMTSTSKRKLKITRFALCPQGGAKVLHGSSFLRVIIVFPLKLRKTF